MRRVDLIAGTYLSLMIVKALHPSTRVPVRHYDMFAYPLPTRRLRTVMVFHTDDGSARVVPAAHVLPFEPARNTSILRTAGSAGPAAVRQLGLTSVRAQRRGWRAIDQVWGPPRPSVSVASAVCIHVVEAGRVGQLADADHGSCRVALHGAAAP